MTARLTDAEIAYLERRRAAFERTEQCVEHRPDGSVRVLPGPARDYYFALESLAPRLLAERREMREALDGLARRIDDLWHCGKHENPKMQRARERALTEASILVRALLSAGTESGQT